MSIKTDTLEFSTRSDSQNGSSRSSRSNSLHQATPNVEETTDILRMNDVTITSATHALPGFSTPTGSVHGYMKDCLNKRNTAESRHSLGKEQTVTNGEWNTVFSRKSNQDPCMMKIKIELPLLDILRSIPPDEMMAVRCSRQHVKPTKPEPPHVLPRKEWRNKYGTPEQARSVLFTNTQTMDDPEENGDSPQANLSYISAMDDLDRMVDGNVDWKKVEELEKTVWKANQDAKCPTFVRQRSIKSYSRILAIALEGCKERTEKLAHKANEYFEKKRETMTGVQFQKMAHFRLLMSDTQREIAWISKQVKTLETEETKRESLTEDKRQRRFPLSTPVMVREQLARQVRVCIEMITVTEELFESVEVGDDTYTKKFIPDM